MILNAAGLIGLYLLWRYVWRLKLAWPWRVLLSAVPVLIVLQHRIVKYLFGGSIASPEIAPQALWVLGACLGAVILFACFLLLRDVVGLLLFVVSRSKGRALWRSMPVAHGLGVLACVLAVIGVWQAVSVPQVKRLEITIPGLAKEFDGYKVVHLTDLHLSKLLQGPWAQQVVERTNALSPDLIVISGDLIDGTPEARQNDYPPLGDLHAKDGVYAVAGNHEYYAYFKRWMRVFNELGIRMLENEHVVLNKDGAQLVLAGVPDTISANFGQVGPDITKALANAPEGVPVILLDHRPGNILRNEPKGVSLQLSGHTHGGHILGIDQVVRMANEGFVSGLYQVGVGGRQLYVGNGAGLWSGFPLRLGRPSEIAEITLRSDVQ
ncbi:metallophosphoesterase [Alcaligenaceae bacterium 429]|uniref:metallophosphoesterase n=1 Tax=Paenalcaligenes sp. Me52 TaxID=3392038 RepID=UPI0010927C4B|nr:metallophosphoesterase [Alcaligenaceae bacterium 429]